MKDGDVTPLLSVMHGGGKCSVNSDCGKFGECSDRNECICFNKTYTGPHCLVRAGTLSINGFIILEINRRQMALMI